MDILKQNKVKQRAVYKMSDCVRKIWYYLDIDWLDNHVKTLNKVVPGYVLNHGSGDGYMWIDIQRIAGIPANQLQPTLENIERVYKFCLESISSTWPYVHGDWAPSNIIVDGDCMIMCDWDNIGQYPEHEVSEKLGLDMFECYGSLWMLFVETHRNMFSSDRTPMLTISAPV